MLRYAVDPVGGGTYRAYVTIAEPVKGLEYDLKSPLPAFVEVIGGVDLNLDHLAIVITDQQGQYRRNKVFTVSQSRRIETRKDGMADWQLGS